MATLLTPFQDDEEDNQQQPQQLTSGLSGATTNNQPAASPGAPTSSGAFVNLKKYVDANKGNSGAMAGTVANYAGGQAETAKAGYQDDADSFKQSVQDNTFKADDNLLDNVTSGTFDVNDSSKIGAGYNAAFDANKSQADYDSVIKDDADALGKADAQIKGTDDYYKRKGLLGDVYGKDNPRYGGGLQSLDSLLITQDDDAKTVLSDLRSKFSGLSDYMKDTNQGVQSQIQSAADATAEARQQYRDAVAAGRTGIQGKVTARAANTNNTRNSDFEGAKNMASWSAKARENPDIDVTQFYTKGGDVGAGDVISTEEAAKLTALAKIANQDATIVSSGRAVDPAFSFDDTGFQAAVAEVARRKAEAEAEAAAAESRRQTAQSNAQGQVGSSVASDGGVLGKAGRKVAAWW